MNATDPTRAAVVVVNWNTRDLLLRCLEGLERWGREDRVEAVVVDNASSDGSAAAARDRFPGAALIRNEVNVGFARAVNQGIRTTTAPLVLLLNPDVVVDPAALRRCADVIEADRGLGALSPFLLDASGRPWIYPEALPTPWTMALGEWASLGRRRPGPSSPTARHPDGGLEEVAWLPGACLFLRREALGAVGLLDERFFLYKEDVDLCVRLRRAGYRIARMRGNAVRHLVAQSTRTNPGPAADRAKIEGIRSTCLYTRKHFGPASVRAVEGALRAGLALRLAKASVLLAVSGKEEHRRKLAWIRRALGEDGRVRAPRDGRAA